MTRPACLCALALVPVAFAGTTARAEQSEPAPVTKQADQKPASDAQSKPAQQQSVQTPQGNGEMETPAQKSYGLPRNPVVGGPPSIDLTRPLTLQDAIQIGLARQNAIAIAKTQSDAASARLTQARSQYYPSVAPVFQYQSTLAPGVRFGSGSNPNAFSGTFAAEQTTAAIAANYLIFDTGRREATTQASRRSAFAAEYNLGNQRQNVVLNVTAAFFNVRRNRELVRVQEESVRRAQTTLEAIQAQVDAKLAAQSDLYQAKSDLANAQVALLQAQNDLTVSVASLKNAMGVVTSGPLVLADNPIPTPALETDTNGLDYFVRLAYQNRLDLKQQLENIYTQGYNVKIAHINNGVTVDATISEGYQIDPDSGETRQFLVSFNYPLFDAGNTSAAVKEQKANLELERRTLDQLQQAIRLNVEQSYSTRELTRQRVAAAQSAVDAGQINYNVALEKQRNGLINILEVLNAQVLLVTAQVNLVQALFDYYIADAQLQRDTGLNDPNYLPRVPKAKPPSPVPAPSTSLLISSPVALNAPTMPASGADRSAPALDAGGGKP